MPISISTFRPPMLLRSAHTQTIWAKLFRRNPQPKYRRERVELSDGDFLDLDCLDVKESAGSVVILPGMEGSSYSPYVRGLACQLWQHNYRIVVLNFRGCSGEPNRLARTYHAGDTQDLELVIATLIERGNEENLYVCGFSLGGNVLLNYLGRIRNRTPITGAVGVSVPFSLSGTVERLSNGISRLYQRHLLASIRRKMTQKSKLGECTHTTITPKCAWRTLRDFDNDVTAKIHGFSSSDHYYKVASVTQFLSVITIPTLLIHALDDPFTELTDIPREQDLGQSIHLEVSAYGGHVGFVYGYCGYWLDQRITDFLNSLGSINQL